MEITNLRVDYHRNGIGGEGYAVAFFDANPDGEHGTFMAILWGDGNDPFTECAVLRTDQVAVLHARWVLAGPPEAIDHNGFDGAFPLGAWRSTDSFGPALFPAVKAALRERYERALGGGA